jgi:hypothetical protein
MVDWDKMFAKSASSSIPYDPGSGM